MRAGFIEEVFDVYRKDCESESTDTINPKQELLIELLHNYRKGFKTRGIKLEIIVGENFIDSYVDSFKLGFLKGYRVELNGINESESDIPEAKIFTEYLKDCEEGNIKVISRETSPESCMNNYIKGFRLGVREHRLRLTTEIIDSLTDTSIDIINIVKDNELISEAIEIIIKLKENNQHI